jgi:hypothetical protein
LTIFGERFFIIYSRWVRVRLKGIYERGEVYKPNGIKTANSAKRIFGLNPGLKCRRKK